MIAVLTWLRSLSLRTRIAALTAGAVAVAVLLVAGASWVLVRRELRSQVDDGLLRRMRVARQQFVSAGPPGLGAPDPSSPGAAYSFEYDNALQVVTANGTVLRPATADRELPVTPRDVQVATGQAGSYLRDVRVDGIHLRVLTARVAPNAAAQLARGLSEIDGTLRGFTLIVLFLSALGVAGAAGAGLLVARRAIAPVERLTGAAEYVARTKELSARIDDDRADELGRLAKSFNEMLAALETSKEQQRRLVADASHELRTPLTSLRTNVEVLSRVADMQPEEREKLMADLRSELEELSALVGELVDLATEQRDADTEEMADIRLDEVVASAVERTERRTGRTIVVDATTSPVHGRPLGLERAVTNLLDNATKWGPADEPIDVVVSGGRVEVRDRGPGVAEADRAHVFDRFYRAPAARSMPGSGLGLAIVKDVAEAHGGRVWVDEAPDGGAAIGFEIPGASSADS